MNIKKFHWVKKEISPIKSIDDAVKNFHIKLANDLLEEDIKNNVYDLNDSDDLKAMKKDYNFWLNDLAPEHNEIIYKKLNFFNVSDLNNQAFYKYVEKENTRTRNALWITKDQVEDAVSSAYYSAGGYLDSFFRELKNNFTEKEWRIVLADGEYLNDFVDDYGYIEITDYNEAKDFVKDFLDFSFVDDLNEILRLEYMCDLIEDLDIMDTKAYKTDIKDLETKIKRDAKEIANLIKQDFKKDIVEMDVL